MLKSIFGKSKSVPAPVLSVPTVAGALSSQSEDTELQEQVLTELKKVVDPDLHQDIVSLGFIKNLKTESVVGSEPLEHKVSFDVELTTPACPVKEQMQRQCQDLVSALDGVSSVDVTMTAKTVGRFSSSQAASTNPRLAGIQNIVAVASGKGGVGKSTTTLQLAMALKKTGASVGILDADVYGPSMVLMTGSTQKASSHKTDSGEELVKPNEFMGIKLISTAMFASASQATILRGPMASSIIRQYLTQVDWGELDYLLIDFPPGTGDIQLTLAQSAEITGGVVVTTPQEVALIDARKAIAMFETLKVPVVGVVENQSYFMCDGCDKKHYLYGSYGGRKIARQYGVPLLGQIPFDPKIAEALDHGNAESLLENENVFSSYREIAGKMAGSLATLHKNASTGLQHFSYSWDQLGELTSKSSSIDGAPPTKRSFLTGVGRKNSALALAWNDGGQTLHVPADLRRSCPCATCVDEHTGQKILKDKSVPDSLEIVQLSSVGRYAIQILFSDGHQTGIYTFERLSQI